MSDNTDGTYREFLLDHYKNPKNKGKIITADISKKDSNPLCGDEIEIAIKLDDKRKNIEEIKFDGNGCVISMACASILAEYLEGKSIAEASNISREDFLSMLELNLTPTRVKCAMLALNTMKKGIIEYKSK